ncbi:MAG: hypothetical protein ACXAAM_07335, partial [Candidatus Heimdallarchaeaceae archaeon]
MKLGKKYPVILIFIFTATFLANPISPQIKQASAWSGDTHGWLSEVAIRLMPSPWDENLLDELDTFLADSNLPDEIRSDLESGPNADPVEFAKEEPRHYIDADIRPELYGTADNHPQPLFNMSKDVFDPETSSDYQLGVAAWAVENWSIQLTEDLQIYDWDDEVILTDMCMLAHYVQDSWMPFHGVSFYDGQAIPTFGDDAGSIFPGGNSGIHGEVENFMIQLKNPTAIHTMLDAITGEAKYRNPYMASLDGILSGEEIARQLCNVKTITGDAMGSSNWRNYVWDNFCVDAEGNYTKRLVNASFETANVWY